MELNMQPPEKRQTAASLGHENLDVHSIFYSIQGEGPFVGTPAVFVRLAGCNLQCPGCDTIYTTGRNWMDVGLIVRCVQSRMGDQKSNKLVVITGGEPFRQDIGKLVRALIDVGCYVQVETNGVLPPPEGVPVSRDVSQRKGFYIVVSPKTGKVNARTEKAACAYKFVMAADSVNDADGLPIHALANDLGGLQVARPPADWKGLLYLQPMDEQDETNNKRNIAACVKSCMQHGYILQLQIHKILGME